jgi:transposase-like protein
MNKGQFRVRKRTQKDYTLAFKIQVVEEVESGQLSQHAVCRKYGIQAHSTVLTWLRKHGKLDWQPKPQAMSKKPTPNKKIAELEKKIKRLEAEKFILNTAIDIADEQLNTDIRKKYLSLLLSESKAQQAKETDSSKQE